MPRFGRRCGGGHRGRRCQPPRPHCGRPRPSGGLCGGAALCRRNRNRRFNLNALRGSVFGGCGGGIAATSCGGGGGSGGCPIRIFNYGPCRPSCGGPNFKPINVSGGCGIFGGKPQNQQEQGQTGQQKPTDPQEPEIIDVPDEAVLQVKGVDAKYDFNTKAHHTNKYDILDKSAENRGLVVRRGQQFQLDIEFNREYDAEKDDLQLIFEFGDDPLAAKNTYVEFVLSDEDKPNKWGAKIISNEGCTLSICVFTPPTLFVGKWEFGIDVIKKGDDSIDLHSYEHDEPFYFLFNPWCKEDSVYLDDEELLKEYLLSESGKIYNGSQNNITSKPWNFGQFEGHVLECVLDLLDDSGLGDGQRGNPITVVRKLSALINSNDDNGLLKGNWSGDYGNERTPLSWTGSVAIIERYWKHKQPVKYGQCWVFSGLGTTLCRALGIPARSVTNFASAHDTDGSVSIDVHFTADLEVDSSRSADSVWNFHVWNEAWMARPDLPKGYGGWQAFDGTPQETSDDAFQCGPVPVNSIKQGDINLPYDGPFVFAEVNADRMYWVPDGLGKYQCAQVDKAAIGKCISTKAPNSQERLDVTNCYKPEEGSAEERAAVVKANQLGSNRDDLYEIATEKDVDFSVKQDCRNTWIGGDFEASLVIRNDSKEDRTVGGRVVVSTMYYTGVVDSKLTTEPFADVKIKAGEEWTQKVKVTAKDYDGKLQDCAMLDLSVWAIVDETNQQFTTKKDFRLRKPHLTIKAPSEGKKGEEIQAEVSFTNPLDTPLTKCFLAVDGLTQELEFPQGSVSAKGTFHTTVPITPKKLGHLELVLSFNSTELYDINGSHPIFIKE